MTFKEYRKWCNNRAADGCWGLQDAMICINIVNEVSKIPFWKREKEWRNKYEQDVITEIVNPINEKISKTDC